MIVALSAVSLAFFTTAARADETVSQAPLKRGVIVLKPIDIALRPPRPHVAVDVGRLVPKAPLPELRHPLLDRIAAAAEADPF